MSISSSKGSGGQSRSLILTAMIFAVAMTFIDQTIVSIAAPQIQRDLGLSSSGMQWAVNSYLLALAALFAFGGRLADTLGHRRMDVRMFSNQPFAVENVILGIAMMAFIPVFFFASLYGQIALGEKATTASLLILYFFLGFVVCAQIGGRMLDRIGAKRPVVLGCALAATGFALWADRAPTLHVGSQVWFIVMAGGGMGLMLGQANTDAVNRASRLSYGEATGITQTVRNYGASLGFAILGTVLVDEFRTRITSSLVGQGASHQLAAAAAARVAQLRGSGSARTIPPFIRADFAGAIREVLYGMAVVMAAAGVVAVFGLMRGVQPDGEPARGGVAGDVVTDDGLAY